MKRLLAIAAFLLASSAAQAQYSFEYGGRTIRIDPDRGTVSIPGVYDNTGRKSKRSHNNQDSGRGKSSAPQDAKSDPQSSPAQAPADTAAAPAAPAPDPANAATTAPGPSTATANNAPTDTVVSPAPPPPAPAPPVVKESAPAPRAEPPSTVAAVPPAAMPAPAPVQRPQGPAPSASAIRDANSPLGVWLTEEKEGKVRIEQCGANLCGYSVDAKSNLNGEQVLINMRPAKDQKWSGRILDPNTGSTYDSTIALKGETLRVQGCAFGGMFCGGQTWTRLN
jgi:uncharacterized protein (DUF2147 family)